MRIDKSGQFCYIETVAERIPRSAKIALRLFRIGVSEPIIELTFEYVCAKGKLFERRGRKAEGLTPVSREVIRVRQSGRRLTFGSLPFLCLLPAKKGSKMQISALELTKLLTAEKTLASKKAGSKLEFKEIEVEALPETRVAEPSKAEVAKVVEMVKSAPDVRDDIVMKLKERIEKGEYNVSGEEIADMMIRRMQADRVR